MSLLFTTIIALRLIVTTGSDGMDECADAIHGYADRFTNNQQILRWHAFMFVVFSPSVILANFQTQAEIRITSFVMDSVQYPEDSLCSQNLNIEFTIDAFQGAQTLQRYPTFLKSSVSFLSP